MDFQDVNSIRLLKNLFDQCRVDGDNLSDSENEGDFPGTSSMSGPASVKSKKNEVKKTLKNSLLERIVPSAAMSMDEWMKQQENDEKLLDHRKQPNYKITFKQSVTTEDIYLQMGMKTPATSSCEDMVVDIELPDETVNIEQMDLRVEADSVHLQTPVYSMDLSLPHQIHPKQGRAEFDSDKKVLKLTLRMNRELDFVNF